MEPVGLIGLGLLGSALADRWLRAGIPVVGYDLLPERRAALEAAGGAAGASSADVARRCPRVALSLLTSAQAAGVVAELEAVLPPGSRVVDTTTGAPEEMEALGRRLAARGVGYLDATVAGSSAEVRRGEVLVLAGGEPDDFAACRDLFTAFARQAFHLGPCGAGARMKLVFNLALGLHRAVLGEALGFAARIGIDPETALAILQQGAAASRVMETKGEKMVRQEFSVQARLSQHRKDVELI
ncbi:MAG: NAD(P)-dependent oxidoreductase, partial [Armatimonadetes bacterium]|nr:NAD(P)-dependent oxidoreductase [Armatimonadota bacterium]